MHDRHKCNWKTHLQMSRDNSLDIPLGNLICKIQNFDRFTIQYQLVQDGSHEQSSFDGIEGGDVITHPVPRIKSGKVAVDVRSALCERRVAVSRMEFVD